MRSKMIFVIIFVCFSFILAANPAYAATITVPSSISSNTTWTNGNVYVISATSTVQAGVTLTVEPGAVIKFNGSSSKLVVRGTLNAIGTEANNIVFTSYKDDSAGGDTNNDGSATTPAKGNWNYIEAYTGGSVNFSYCQVRYGGYNSAQVYSSGGSISIDHSVVEQSNSRGIETKGTASITDTQVINCTTTGIYINSGSPTISGNTISTGNYGIYIANGSTNINNNSISSCTYGLYVLAGSHTFSSNTINNSSNSSIAIENATCTVNNNTISQCSNEAIRYTNSTQVLTGNITGNTFAYCKTFLGFRSGLFPTLTLKNNTQSNCTYNGIYIYVTSFGTQTMPMYQCPYIVDTFTTSSASTIEIQPGTIFKLLASKSAYFYGTVTMEGTPENPIVFTSIKDDAHGGDTNNDGSQTSPASGDYNQITLGQDSISTLKNAKFLYGGNNITIHGANKAEISNCEIGYAMYRGIMLNLVSNVVVSDSDLHDCNWYGAIYFGPSSSAMILRNNIHHNGKGIYLISPNEINVLFNNFYNNDIGFYQLARDTFNATIQFNNFYGNTSYGFYSLYDTMNVQYNWWGDASGPGPAGLGDKIYKGNAAPWLKSAYVVPNSEFYLGKRPWDFQCNDPVNGVTGNFTYDKTDINIPTRGVPLTFSRYYNSLDSSTSGPLGRGWQHNYNSTLTLNQDGSATVLYPDGHQVDFANSGGSYVRPAACYETLTAVTGGFELTLKDQTVYAFDNSGKLSEIRDKNGNTTILAYNGSLLQTVTEPGGRALQFSYYPDNKLQQVTDPGNRTLVFTYDPAGNLSAMTDVNSGVWQYGYTNNYLDIITDPRNHVVVSNTYDGQGRVVSQLDGENHLTAFAYDPETRVNTVTDENQNSVAMKYDLANRITEMDYPGDITESFTYDGNNNRTSVMDKNGNTTYFSYDEMGNTLSKTDPAPLNYATTFTYDGKNNPTEIVDAANNLTDMTYDSNGNLLTVSRAVYGGTAVTTMAYNQYGQVISVTNPNNAVTQYEYDSYGNRASETDPLGNVTTYTYDLLGRKLTRVDPRGNLPGADPADFQYTYTYDPAGNILTVTDPLGKVTANTYDLNNNLLTTTDPNNNVATCTYDNNNRLLTVEDPLDNVTAYTYDADGNRTSVTDPLNHMTTYVYDPLNRLISVTDPDNKTESYTLDGNGNRLTVTDRNNHSITTVYDVLNRPVQVTDPLNKQITMQYDPLGNKLSVTDQRNNTTVYTYDQNSKLLTITEPGNIVTSYTYDLAGNKLTATDPRNQV